MLRGPLGAEWICFDCMATRCVCCPCCTLMCLSQRLGQRPDPPRLEAEKHLSSEQRPTAERAMWTSGSASLYRPCPVETMERLGALACGGPCSAGPMLMRTTVGMGRQACACTTMVREMTVAASCRVEAGWKEQGKWISAQMVLAVSVAYATTRCKSSARGYLTEHGALRAAAGKEAFRGTQRRAERTPARAGCHAGWKTKVNLGGRCGVR